MKPHPTLRARAAALVAAIVTAALAVVSQPAAAQLVDIANGPIFAARQPHPNVAVTTSVEFPTVGAAYNNIPFDNTRLYLGYFDATKCYAYSGMPASPSAADYFYPTVPATTTHDCSDAFSGNFLNWLTMSAIDEFRYAMTGGNRVDENGPNNGTIIERATLPDGLTAGVQYFYAFPNNFAGHSLTAPNTYDANFPSAYGSPSSYTSTPIANIVPNSIVAGGGTTLVASCGNYVYFSTALGGGSGAMGGCNIAMDTHPNHDRGGYRVRVLVCTDTEGPARPDLCQQYAGGKYKPVGQIEVNADRMRFAAFGYLLDRNVPAKGYTVPCDDGSTWNRCRYGGVLRAPMTYVGPTKYDASLIPSTNGAVEINTDGTLVDDPEHTASSAGGIYSGVINYINKFGADGVYKRYDTMGEMFYEAIRYYQHLSGPNAGPTLDAVSGGYPDEVKGGFPVVTDWSVDPIIQTCSQNYIINLSDANTWEDMYVPGYNGSPAPSNRPGSRAIVGGLDAPLWTKRIGDLESSTPSFGPPYQDVQPALAGIESRYQIPPEYNTWFAAGIAYWANVTDIRPDLPGTQTVKTISFDVAEPSIDIHLRQLYLMGKYGGFNNTIDRPSDGFANPFYAADPGDPTTAIRSNSEWEDSPGSQYPANYLLASDPQKLINGLRAAFAKISASTGNLSGASLTSANLTYGAANAYIATFNPARWSGSVLQKSLSVDSSGNLVVSTGSTWDAGALLTARCGTVPAASAVCSDGYVGSAERNIVTTARMGGTGVRVATNFTYAALTAAGDSVYLAALNTNPTTHATDSYGPQRLNFLRGYRADEASGLFRGRDSVMGDIVNSGPLFVGPPTTSIPDADYQAFYNTYRSRLNVVYVGSNDGMLHALSASDGSEVFAYIPGYSRTDLADLTSPGYTHEVFVDTVPKIEEVKVSGNWKTVLVGASGNGAQGIFGLDVSNPAAFGPGSVLFEFSDADDADFGNVVAQPEIAKLKVGVSSGVPVYRYFAVVTGYNNRRTTQNGHAGGDTHVSTDTTNKGVLFLIALDHVLGTPWVSGSDYYKFYFPAANASLANGLGPVSLRQSKSGDGSTDAMYFGDLQGDLWKFNTATGDPTTWSPALGSVASPLPLFVAMDASSNRQPITARPELGSGPFGGTLVFFGTGEFLGITDATTAIAQQSEYAFLDTGPSVALTRSGDLVQRTPTLSSGVVTVTGPSFAYSGASSKKGWYIDFPSSTTAGERSVTKPAVGSGVVTFTTLTLASDICGSGGGYVYQVNALTGLTVGGLTAAGYTSTVGIPGPPRIVDLTLGAGATRATGEIINNKRQGVIVSGTLAKIAQPGEVIASKAQPVGRINWREISNWNDLTHR